MDPNSSQPVTPNLQNDTPAPVVPPPAPGPALVPPPTAAPQVPEPAQTPSVVMPPSEGPKKGLSLITVALVLMVVVLIVALGYIAYTKFVAAPAAPATTIQQTVGTTPPAVEEVQPTDTPQATDSGATINIPTDNPNTPTDAPVPTNTP